MYTREHLQSKNTFRAILPALTPISQQNPWYYLIEIGFGNWGERVPDWLLAF
jgi:hypothetical protein